MEEQPLKQPGKSLFQQRIIVNTLNRALQPDDLFRKCRHRKLAPSSQKSTPIMFVCCYAHLIKMPNSIRTPDDTSSFLFKQSLAIADFLREGS